MLAVGALQAHLACRPGGMLRCPTILAGKSVLRLDCWGEAGAPAEWWDDFVRGVLGKPSALRPDERGELRILAE